MVHGADKRSSSAATATGPSTATLAALRALPSTSILVRTVLPMLSAAILLLPLRLWLSLGLHAGTGLLATATAAAASTASRLIILSGDGRLRLRALRLRLVRCVFQFQVFFDLRVWVALGWALSL